MTKKFTIAVTQALEGKGITHSIGNKELSEAEFERLEIFKLQIPISTNANVPLGLVYNEDRSIEFHIPAADIAEYFKPGQFKRYTWGFVDEKQVLQLFNLPNVKEQDW